MQGYGPYSYLGHHAKSESQILRITTVPEIFSSRMIALSYAQSVSHKDRKLVRRLGGGHERLGCRSVHPDSLTDRDRFWLIDSTFQLSRQWFQHRTAAQTVVIDAV